MVGVRPESFSLSDGDGIKMEVAVVEETGADAYLYGVLQGQLREAITTDDSDDKQLVARVTTRTPPQRGTVINLAVDPAAVHIFDKESGARIS